MTTEVRVKFFRIDRLGYFRRHSSQPAYGKKLGTLNDLRAWISGKTLSETSTYSPTEEQDENILHTYCYNVDTNSSDDYLLTLWNETATTEGAVASVNVTGHVGSAAVTAAEVPEGYKPGYPSYFWFPGGKSVYATIQINNRLNGRRNLEEFVKGFLAKYSKHAVVETSDEGEEVVAGYSKTGKKRDIDGCRPSFKSTEFRKPGNHSFIRSNRQQIRKLVRRDLLQFQYVENLSLWQALYRNFSGESSKPVRTGEHEIQYEVEYTPTSGELEQVINHWQNERDADGSVQAFQDIGFKLQGDSKVHWLSSSLASEKVALDVRFQNHAVVDTELLLKELDRQRSRFLALLSRRSSNASA